MSYKCYVPKEVFMFYYRLLFSADNRTIIVGLQEINHFFQRQQVLLPQDKKRLDIRLKELLETTDDEAVRRCAYRLCAFSYSPEIADVCLHLLPKEANPDNKMSIIPILYGTQSESSFRDFIKRTESGLSAQQITLAKCYFPNARAQYLDKKLLNGIFESNDITALRWLPIISNSQNNAERRDSLLTGDVFSELAKHEDTWVQKYALGAFNHFPDFRLENTGLDYTTFLRLNPQPKKSALTIIWKDKNFVNTHLDFIEEILSPRNLFAEYDQRTREGIAKGLSSYGYNEKIASCVIEWFSIEEKESVIFWLKAYMRKHMAQNKNFQYALEENITDIFYGNQHTPFSIQPIHNVTEDETMEKKAAKIFVSHSSDDKYYAETLVDFLEDIGVRKGSLFCSSVPGFGIPIDEDIYSYLRNQFEEYSLHVIFLLSPNYYKSVACLNEMGAAWMAQSRYTTFLLPRFEYREIKGAINPKRIAIRMDDNEDQLKEQLGELRAEIVNELGITGIDGIRWEKKRNSFIKAMKIVFP